MVLNASKITGSEENIVTDGSWSTCTSTSWNACRPAPSRGQACEAPSQAWS